MPFRRPVLRRYCAGRGERSGATGRSCVRLHARGPSVVAPRSTIVLIGPVLGATPAGAATHPYLLGDSVAAWSAASSPASSDGRAHPGRGGLPRHRLRAASPPVRASAPRAVSATIRAQRGRLGRLVVIELGYNDRPLRTAIDRVLGELRTQGVRRVVWVNLSERRAGYHETNVALDAATKRWPELRILDWRRASAGHARWFIDGVHLTTAGKAAFAQLLAQSISRLR